MESNDDLNLKAINASVGRLVWVRRRNGSWWPGQTLIPENSLVSPKLGTPIKLLGRDDVSVDWYILEKSKMVKAFRCGEYDTCIEKAKAAVAARFSNKKSVKLTRREDAINNALEIENEHLAKEDHSDSADEGDELDLAAEQLESSFHEMNKLGACKLQRKRRRTPNDSEDEGIKRMRGLEDIGKEHIGVIREHKQEMGLICDDSTNFPNNLKVRSLKRKRSQVFNECSKRKNRRRQLTKVLESTAMVCVHVSCDQDSEVAGMECVESVKSVSVVINNNSDSNGVSSENVVGGLGNSKAKDGEISSVSAEDDLSDQLFDVPLTGEEKQSAGFPAAYTISSSKKALVSCSTRQHNNNSQLVICNSTSEWQLKRRRNSRQMSKKNNNNNTLFEVKIEVKPNHSKPCNVPLVSRMSELNGKAIVGHPLTVEILEEVVKMKLKKKKNLHRKPLKKKSRRLSTITSERSKKQIIEKVKETVVACIPLKVVFSRINEVLKARQMHYQVLPFSDKT